MYKFIAQVNNKISTTYDTVVKLRIDESMDNIIMFKLHCILSVYMVIQRMIEVLHTLLSLKLCTN